MLTPSSCDRSRLFWGVMAVMALLPLILAACGGSSNPSTASVYIDEHAGSLNGKDAPQMDKFWFSSSQTDQNFSTSYSISIAPSGTLTVYNEGDDPQNVTITGPNNYNHVTNIATGPASAAIQMPDTAGTYTIISDPVGAPTRPGARGGTITVG